MTFQNRNSSFYFPCFGRQIHSRERMKSSVYLLLVGRYYMGGWFQTCSSVLMWLSLSFGLLGVLTWLIITKRSFPACLFHGLRIFKWDLMRPRCSKKSEMGNSCGFKEILFCKFTSFCTVYANMKLIRVSFWKNVALKNFNVLGLFVLLATAADIVFFN